MKISIDIEVKRGEDKQLNSEAGELVLKDAIGLVQDPDNSPERFDRRKAWLGGAIKMFCVLTGMSEAEASSRFSFKAPASAAVASSRYADLLAPGATVEPPPGK